ncbi:bifunctional enoyl-CoA hydratase/phosphate acetyltransferase [Magnetospirillum sp. UT-4]|uniref:bifunctional enoyl-CoA hydratase/phosphate acetyltransferase n=1 Tax=Magnetospirillum sp. UT-4 TaxID=2681467 RepID=UPI0013840BFE|nr:bifunctional enoyl-CoA hydratase/phosphate acetyltransferase [Magnetospirillum sp. UT-4]CAA7625917.1 Phosphate butyryltransferase [Magnetospirillum sp. UT-4]
MAEMMENRTWDEIRVGDTATLTRNCRMEDVELFGVATGDLNPTHYQAEQAQQFAHHRKVVAHSMWGGSLVSALLGNELPGPGTVYKNQDFEFLCPVEVGDTITVTVKATDKAPPNEITFDCLAVNQNGDTVFRGLARVYAPTVKVVQPRMELHEVSLRRRAHVFEDIIARCATLEPISVAVCHPCDQVSLEGPYEAYKRGLIIPILVGPEAKIRSLAQEHGFDLTGLRIIDTQHSHESAEKAVQLCRSGECEALMKGSLHTDEMMHEVARRDTGLRTGRRISHVFVMDVPTYPKTLLITDAAINIYPTLEDKVDICQNAIDLAHCLGVAEPRVAILSAVETVYPKINSTIEAAALCKMADRGQITGGLLDGPLAFDNAISAEAARIKKIKSPVAGDADILLVPDLEAGNMLAKQLSYLAEADAAGIVLGARVPVVLTSRADSAKARLASCAVAVLFAHARRTAPSKAAAE